MEPARPYIGGQAVLEGVMMRSPGSFAVVVRRRDGSLNVRERVMPGGRTGLAKLPFFRGVASLVESLRLGSEALKFSADLMQKDFDAPVVSSIMSLIRAIGFQLFLLSTTEAEPPAPAPEKEKKGIGPMLVIMVLFLIALPQITAAGIMKLFHVDWPVTSVQFQALTGGVKLGIVLGYLLLIRRMADIRRVFQYHGAEHKTISTYEANEPLDVEHARAKTTLHPRCGTTFLVMVVIISVFLFSILGAILGAFLPPTLTGSKLLDNVLFLLMKLPALPVLAAVTFEIQRLFARYCTTGPLRALLVPGFLVQKITTIEPDDSQLEVALASLRATLFREEGHAGKGKKDVAFPTYAAMAAAATLRG
jgi:uncharacterized protein YqhQ